MRYLLYPLSSSFVAGVAAGCIFPPPLENEVEQDAGINGIPVIVKTDGLYPSPGPIIIDTQLIEDGEQPDPMTLVVRDPDTSDQVHIYFYVDYGRPDPTPPRNECHGPAGEVDRTLSCDIDRLCQDITPPASGLFVEAMVVDQMPTLSGEPLFRAIPDNTGLSFRSWLLECQ